MSDPWQYWSAEAIANASQCPLANVQEHHPRIVTQLIEAQINSPNVQIGVIGTTAIESASNYAPVREGCYLGEPEPAETHRRSLSYYPYYGRGEIQLTHEGNYKLYGQKVAAFWGEPAEDPLYNLVANPDNALQPDMAAAIIALYFRDTRALPSPSYPQGYTLVQACELQDWEWVRRLVYGGADPTGTARIERIARQLGPPAGVAPPPPALTVRYDPTYPSIAQNDSWSCSTTSMRWCLFAYGREPSEAWIEGSMLNPNQPGGPVVTTEFGLMDASGAGLVAWVEREYAEYGYKAQNDPSLAWSELVQEATTNKHPVMIGGRTWYHWSGVRGFDSQSGQIKLANPAPGWKGIGQTLSQAQFEYLGPFSLVRLTHPTSESAQPPQPPSDPYANWRGVVGSGLLEMMAQDKTLPAQRASTWLPLGTPPPSDVETCYGENGTLYYWLITVGRGYRTRPS